MLRGIKTRTERERAQATLIRMCRSQSQPGVVKRSERGWQRDAGRETQAEMQAEPDIALAGA